MATAKPRIYVASLSDYNAGNLHGVWIDANQDASDIMSAIKEMLLKSSQSVAEDWALHDYEGFCGINLSEYTNIKTVSELAKAVIKHGSAFAAYWNNLGGEEYCSIEDFEDKYFGTYESEVRFVEEIWENDGIFDKLLEIGINRYYLDLESVARDWFINDYFSVIEDSKTCHVFSNS